MEKTPTQTVSEMGSRLLQLSRPNKGSLVKSLREVATTLSQIEQPRVTEIGNKKKALKMLEAELKPLTKSIIKHDLLKSRDNDVSFLVTVCVTQIFRILAPEPPFEDKYLRDIFNLFLAEFSELSDTGSPYFSKRAKILETVSRCKCCLLMLDVECYDLIHEMFNIFFSVVREHHEQNLVHQRKDKTQQRNANTQQTQQSLFNDILTIMVYILKEEASSSLVDVILQNLVKEEKDATSAANNLASSLIESCTDTLEPLICSFLTSCFTEKDSIQTNLKYSYHEIIFKISLSAPQILLAVIPNLTKELLTDQVDVRIKALNLTGRIFAQPKQSFGEMYHDLFAEFLRRFSDKSAEVRIAALKCGQQCYLVNRSGNKASGVLTAIQERLLDFDDRVRTQALVVASDIMKSNMKYVPLNLISEAIERLRDKKISVRKKALQKLTEVYQDYCDKCSEGKMTINDHFEHIPCKILLLCCDKNCEEFRPQTMELVLSDDLFPRHLPVEERMRHWVQCFSVMNHIQLKSLNSILSQKRRLQIELRHCLVLWGQAKDHNIEEVQRKHKSYFVKLSACFPDASKAEGFFHNLDQMRDASIFDALTLLLDELTSTKAQTIREKFLKTIGSKHHLFEFLRTLTTKCSPSIFSSEHVQYLLNQLCGSTAVNAQLKAPSIKLLLVILNMDFDGVEAVNREGGVMPGVEAVKTIILALSLCAAVCWCLWFNSRRRGHAPANADANATAPPPPRKAKGKAKGKRLKATEGIRKDRQPTAVDLDLGQATTQDETPAPPHAQAYTAPPAPPGTSAAVDPTVDDGVDDVVVVNGSLFQSSKAIKKNIPPTAAVAQDGQYVMCSGRELITVSTSVEGGIRDLVEDTKWGEPVKVIKNLRVSTESHIGALEEYNNILKVSFNSKYVVNVYDYCQEEDAEGYGYMCVEAGGFRLSDLIKFVGNKAQICDGKHRMIKDLVKANWGKLRGPSGLKKSVIRCLAEGVNDMHLKRIIHRNLDPTSVELFLGDSLNSLVPKICNFGVSAGLGNNQNSFQPSCSRGVFPWLAPEQMNNKEEGYHVDYFYLGCLISLIAFGEHPFKKKEDMEKGHLPNPLSIKDDEWLVWDLIKRLVKRKPGDRLSASGVLKHPFFWDVPKKMTFIRVVEETTTSLSRQNRILVKPYFDKIRSRRAVIMKKSSDWKLALDLSFREHLDDLAARNDHRRVSYSGKYVADLIRLIRNTIGHHGELPGDIKNLLGTYHRGLHHYFDSRFPNIVLILYEAIQCINGYQNFEEFQPYF